MTILDNVAKSASPEEGTDFAAKDENFQGRFPGLFELLATTHYEGSKRKLAKLILYYDSGKAAVCVSDAHTGRVAFHLDEGLEEALEGLERRLQAGKVDWRKSRKWQG